MDPFSVISIIDTAASLVLRCGKTAQSLHSLAGKYRHGENKILAMKSQCLTLELAWNRIKSWCEAHEESDLSDALLIQRLNEDLELGMAIMSALEKDLSSFLQVPRSILWQRTKLVWNEALFQDHQSVLDRHVISTTLLLQTTLLPTSKKRSEFLIEKEKELNECNASARTIIQSQASSIHSREGSIRSYTSLPLSYRTLDISEQLFEGTVYKRSGWNITLARNFKRRQPKPSATEAEVGVKPKSKNEQSSVTRTSSFTKPFEINPWTISEAGPWIEEKLEEEEIENTSKGASDRIASSSASVASSTLTQQKVSSYDESPERWSEDLIAACRDGHREKVRKLLAGRSIYHQPSDVWFRGGSEALYAAVSHNRPAVVRVLLDHCIFSRAVLAGRQRAASMLKQSWSSHTASGSSEEFFCDLFELADALGTMAVIKELTRFDALSMLFVTQNRMRGQSLTCTDPDADTIAESITLYGTSSGSSFSSDPLRVVAREVDHR